MLNVLEVKKVHVLINQLNGGIFLMVDDISISVYQIVWIMDIIVCLTKYKFEKCVKATLANILKISN